jgi:hypothetical protein
MLVGISQGGLDARQIAGRAQQYGLHVTTVVTFGMPVNKPDVAHVRTVNIQARSSEGIPDAIPYVGGFVNGFIHTGIVTDGLWGMADQSPMVSSSVFEGQSSVSVAQTLFVEHGDYYPSAARDFDNDTTDARFAGVKESMQNFQGAIVGTWDSTWSPGDGG